jgi:hypothetical protein
MLGARKPETSVTAAQAAALRFERHHLSGSAGDLAFYVAALKPMATGTLRRWQARIGATPSHVRAMVEAVVDGLGGEPRRSNSSSRARKRRPARRCGRGSITHGAQCGRPW